MKVTLNAVQYKNNSSGIGRLIYQLYSALIEEAGKSNSGITFEIISSKNSPEFLFEKGEPVIIRRLPFNKEEAIRRNIYELFSMGSMVDKSSDAYISLDAKLPLFLRPGLKKILAVPDLAVYRMGEVYQAIRTAYWRLLFKESIIRADKLIAISEFVKKEIIDILRINPAKISVIYMAANSSFKKITDGYRLESIRNKYNLHTPFLLFVGTISPRKNLFRLLKAFLNLKKRRNIPHKLVIVGEKGWKFSREFAFIKKHKLMDNVVVPGYIPDEELPSIYSLAELTVCPSLYEGFGIPVIESMCCGTPVALSNTACLPEIAGDAGVYFDPFDIEDMSDKIMSTITNDELVRTKVAAGYEVASRYSWSKSGRQLLDIIEQYFV